MSLNDDEEVLTYLASIRIIPESSECIFCLERNP